MLLKYSDCRDITEKLVDPKYEAHMDELSKEAIETIETLRAKIKVLDACVGESRSLLSVKLAVAETKVEEQAKTITKQASAIQNALHWLGRSDESTPVITTAFRFLRAASDEKLPEYLFMPEGRVQSIAPE